MDKIKDYFSSPATWRTLIIFIFWLGVTWWTLSGRINQIEREMDRIDQLWIETKLTELQIDMQRVKTTLEEIKRSI